MSSALPPLAPGLQRINSLIDAPAEWRGGRHLSRRAARLALLLCSDVALLAAYGTIVRAMRVGPWFSPEFGDAMDRVLPPGGAVDAQFGIAVILCLALFGGYDAADGRQADGRRVVSAALAVTLLAWDGLWGSGSPLVLTAYVVLTSLLVFSLLLARRLARRARRRVTPRRLRAARALLVAGGRDIPRARRHPALSDYRMFSICGVIDPEHLGGRGALEELCEAIRRCDADTILLCCGSLSDRAFSVVLDAATSSGCGLVSVTRSPRGAGAQPKLMWHHGSSLMVLASPANRAVQRLLKRVLDIVGAAVGLVLVAPLIGLIAVAIRLDSRGPILFGHRRIGAWGRPFRCLKFRTMRVDAEQVLRNDPVLHQQYVKNNYKLPEGQDPRITRIGEMLRGSSLDELPQLWNVLRGDMSLIGPRPVVPDELNEYGEKRRVLLSVKPGMSGAWAITGRSRVGYPYRAAIELRYVRRWGLLADLAILWRTLPAVIARRGAH